MARRHTDNPEASGTLNEFRDEDGNLNGIQLYMVDERQFGEILLDWMIGNGYSLEKPGTFLREIGLANYIREDQWKALLCGMAAPGRNLTNLLADAICSDTRDTRAKIQGRASWARRSRYGTNVVEVFADVKLHVPEASRHESLDEYPQSEDGFGTLLAAHIRRADLSHAELNARLEEIDPAAGGNVSRWIDGSRRPRSASLAALGKALGLTEEEHGRLIDQCWQQHTTVWKWGLDAARELGSFGAMFQAHRQLAFCRRTRSPYTYEALAQDLGISTRKIWDIEREAHVPDDALFEKIVHTLVLPDADEHEMRHALERLRAAKLNKTSEIEEVTQRLASGQEYGCYVDLAKLYRKQSGRTVSETVEALGVGRDLINFLEQGKRLARPETRQRAKEYLGMLGMPAPVQDMIIFAMDYTNLKIADKLQDLEAAQSSPPYDFAKLISLYRQTALKPDGGIGLVSCREAEEMLVQMSGADKKWVTEGTIRNWEIGLGVQQPQAMGKVVATHHLKPYLDVIQMPSSMQTKLFRRLEDHQEQRSKRSSVAARAREAAKRDASHLASAPELQVSDGERHGLISEARIRNVESSEPQR